MLLDLHELPGGTTFDSDICIIGTGPAGIALAQALAGSKLKIVMLESGGLQIDPNTQQLNAGENIGLLHDGLFDGRGRALGGSGKLWAGQCLPLDPLDFEKRPWVPFSGWPAATIKLSAYYRRAEAFFKIDGNVYDQTIYHRFGLPPPPWASDALQSQFTIYTPQVDIAREHMRALRRSPDIRVVTHANAVRITANEAINHIESVVACSASGQTCVVHARVVVLCGGGMENARLLLSSNHQESHGIGNRRGLVGRFFQDHPNGFAATLSTKDVGDLQDRFRLLYRGRLRFFPKFALSPERQKRERVLNANAHLVFEYDEQPAVAVMRDLLQAARRRAMPSNVFRQVMKLAGDAGTIAPMLWRRYAHGRSPNGKPTSIRLQCYLEQAPNPESRIVLSDQLDQFGVPQIRLDWRLTNLERDTLRTLVSTARDEFQRLGLGQLRSEHWVDEASDAWKSALSDCYHHAGTTRMSDDPMHGVVDANCQVFGVAGLYVCGGSVFPTSGYANPTLTIVALALRLADYLRGNVTTSASPGRADGPAMAFAG